MNLMLNELFQQLSRQSRLGSWTLALHYRFIAGRGYVAPLTLEPLPAHAESVRHTVEYDAVPLVSVIRDTNRAHYTLRVVYHAPSDTYYYGIVRTAYTSVSSTVWWYHVPHHVNDILTYWFRRCFQYDLPSLLDLELTQHATTDR